MKISRIEITNFQGLRDARLSVKKPVTFLCGKNGAGKSTLLEGVRLALLGNAERVTLKKDLGQLVTAGSKKGGVNVVLNDNSHYSYSLPDGKHQMGAEIGPHVALVLEAQNFARATADQRRSTLFSLTGCKVSAEDVEKRLLAKGAAKDKVSLVLPMLRSGFPAAADMAKTNATQSKGSWRAITGETYGDKKAETWAPAMVEPVNVQALSDAAATISATEALIADLNGRLGAARENMRNALANAANNQAMKEKADQLPRLRKKLEVDQAELAKWEVKLAEAKASIAPAKINKPAAKLDNAMVDAFAVVTAEWMELVGKTQGVVNNFNVCENWDHHHGLVNRTSAHLSSYKAQHGEPLAQADETAPEQTGPSLRDLESSRDIYKRAVENDLRDIAAAEHAALQVAGASGVFKIEADQSDIEHFVEAIASEQAKLKSARERLQSLDAQDRAFREAKDAAKKAAQYHRDVVEWSAIADALSPSGIPSEILAGALRPANDYLHELASFANWKRVAIGTEMEITADGRPYALLSESEKWRTDCLLAMTVAKLSGLKIALLDRFDVLDGDGRNDVIDLLDELAAKGEIDTAFIAGTLKQAPAGLPETFETIWIENGEINNLKLDGEAA